MRDSVIGKTNPAKSRKLPLNVVPKAAVVDWNIGFLGFVLISLKAWERSDRVRGTQFLSGVFRVRLRKATPRQGRTVCHLIEGRSEGRQNVFQFCSQR